MSASPPAGDAPADSQGRGRPNSADPDAFAELEAEVIRLRARVAQLESEKAALLRAAAHRDYERPPHYQ